MQRRSPPPTLEALIERARALAGRSLGELSYALGAELADDSTKTKGKFGVLLEAALGATGGSGKSRDFPELGVELKTLPVRPDGIPTESTYVCTLHVQSASELAWESSWVKDKLSRVLFVPVQGGKGPWADRLLGRAFLWSPSAEEEATLRKDFEDLVGMVVSGRVESLSAHHGVALQVRPKAADGSKTATVRTDDGELVQTVPKGFYLRTSFTGALLAKYGLGR